MSQLSREAFEKLLEAMGPDRESAGAAYEQLRQRLLRFFRWESCPRAEDCADEVFNRLGAKLVSGERISNPLAYAGGIARLVLKETNRKQAREQQQPLAGPVDSAAPAMFGSFEEPDEESARTRRCFDQCLAGLPGDARQLLLDYYEGEAGGRIANRQRMAMRMQLSLNSLRNRALRLREKLEACVNRCAEGNAA